MIYIIGGTNIDMIAKINSKVRLYESNPGIIYKKPGGVGRNIAEAISNFNTCEFVTSVPNKVEYCTILNELNKKGVSTKYSKLVNDKFNSTYLDIIDENGVVLGLADMSAIDELNVNDLEILSKKITDDDIVEIDANFDLKIVSYVIDNFKGTKMLEAVSSKKLERLRNVLDKFNLVKMNNYEYEYVKDLKLKNTLVTYGNKIVLNYDKKIYEVSHNTLKAINPTGCGDTFFGTFIANYNKGIKEALKTAVIAAAAASQTENNVPTIDEINKINIDELNITFKE